MATTHPSPAPAGVKLAITGMTCSGCVNALTRALSRVPGVTNVKVDLASGRAQITGGASPASLVAAVEKAGYGARLAHDGDTRETGDGHGTRA